MTGFIPALRHSATAAFDSSLGGSIIAIRPTNSNPSSSSGHTVSLSNFFSANASIRRPFSESSATRWVITAFSSSLEVILFIRTSAAPFTYSTFSPSITCRVDISFLSESNGISEILGRSSLTLSVSIPSFVPKLIRAVSVGSPISTPSLQLESLQRIMALVIVLTFSSSRSTASVSIILPSTIIFLTVILFCVSVPVLSEHITETLPKPSTA